MKIVRFLGGLGNQMFQYAFYKAIQNKFSNVKADLSSFKSEHHHNGYELERIFDISVDEASVFMSGIYNIQNQKWIYRKLRQLLDLKKSYHEEQLNFSFDPKIFSDSKSGYYYGFWQNEKYYAHISSQIRKDFEFKPLTDNQNIDILDKINQTNSISIHVRRGDYVAHPSFGGVCEKDYYQKAIQKIHQQVINAKFFIFSNDINWCMNNLETENCDFISWNTGTNSYIDMQLMSNCKHNIIANSSFSWWAAWLNANPDKIVIGPQKWLNETKYDTSTLMPADWIRL